MIRLLGYRQSLWWLLGVAVAVEGAIILGGVLRWGPWGDESHFVETVRLFAQAPSLATLRHYPEMSGPLPFAMYAVWGALFGMELWTLRLLSVLIAITSYLLFHRIVWLVFRNGLSALLLTVFLMVHPYMVGFSAFVFTDGPAILFVLITLLGALRFKPSLLFIGLAGALLSRQYLVFLMVAVVVWGIVLMRDRAARAPGMAVIAASLAAVIPLVVLAIFWGGFSPDNDLRRLYLTEGLYFHPSYLVLYVSLLFFYLLPVVVFGWRPLYRSWKINTVAIVLGSAYWFFPVEATVYAEDIGVTTVGLFHKAVTAVSASPWFSQGVFFVGFVLGLPIVIQIIRSATNRIRSGRTDILLLLDLSILAFLVVMPFSYLNWEKYLMPLLPLAAVRLAALRLPVAEPAL